MSVYLVQRNDFYIINCFFKYISNQINFSDFRPTIQRIPYDNVTRNCNNVSEYHGHSGESFCSSDISLDGSNFDQIDEGTSDTLSLQNLDLQNHHQPVQHAGLLHESMNLTTNSIINPIDKLYLMQNSYFNSEN